MKCYDWTNKNLRVLELFQCKTKKPKPGLVVLFFLYGEPELAYRSRGSDHWIFPDYNNLEPREIQDDDWWCEKPKL